jgi:predicted RNA-binding protein with PIN domain
VTILVDGMNVIGARPDGWWRDRDAAVRRLHQQLRALAERGDQVVLVLDGLPLPDLPEGDAGGVTVRYASRRGRDAADDRLVELVAAQADAGGLEVVTADRELRQRVAPYGVTVSGPRTLLDRLPS